jgi:hypothetical protein
MAIAHSIGSRFVLRFYLIAALLVGAGIPAMAHHSFAAFDQSREVTLQGEVTEFQWTNPHAWLIVKVKGPNRQGEEWSFEMLSPNVLGRMGWKKTSLKVGDQVTVTASPAKDGSHFGLMRNIVGPDGRPIGGPAR